MPLTLRIKLAEYEGEWSKFDTSPVYAIWHNQEIGIVTFRTETGFHSVPATIIELIEFRDI